ncbi:glycerol-3-phosphate 1-O-acyltransferase [Ktedonosporobacter rubrisoli]|uniref:Glycerol-3-phosphate acyltransferase n=1 Tax=Ktedonosporobacter rubrisoli TaxID=2509675 RepID=A0A4P6JR41_KTERU|nr:glycerol-3-phosphate 1-O-acyltransferase PlsY [Ktedonosporobacter rubrisoli]QBD77753.1 glycerol-3-phosphate 1-O-acyltransferase [Ktedonosporobacter rubrisoli]
MIIFLLQLVLIACIGYLWGSIPAGYWMGKILRGKDFDIRAYGSHKIGATNVLRTLGKIPALIVFLFDLTKGVLPTLLSLLVPFFYAAGWGPMLAALTALLGHCFPLFIGFRGGRGVLTGSGALLLISPLTFVIGLITTLGTIAISRYVSLGSIVGCLTTIVCGLIFFFIGLSQPTFIAKVSLPNLIFMLIGPTLVILFHYDNIGRLLKGTERKIGQKISTV